MGYKTDRHGGNGRTAEELERARGIYAKARVDGKTKMEAAKEAGLTANPEAVKKLERPGSPAALRIIAELDSRGMDEAWLADRYKEAIERAQAGTKRGQPEVDTSGLAKLLLQVSYLRGHGRQGPQVAVQINTGGPGGASAGRIEEVAERLSRLAELVEEEISRRDPGRVLEGSIEPPDSPSHLGVVSSGGGA